MKKLIKLNEQGLHNLITETVKMVLSEKIAGKNIFEDYDAHHNLFSKIMNYIYKEYKEGCRFSFKYTTPWNVTTNVKIITDTDVPYYDFGKYDDKILIEDADTDLLFSTVMAFESGDFKIIKYR